MHGCLSCAPCRGPGLQPRHVPWLGIEPVTSWSPSQHSIHWATPARALISYSYSSSGHLSLPSGDLCLIHLVSSRYFQSVQLLSVFTSSIDRCDVLFPTPSQGSRARFCGSVFIKSTVVYSNALGLHIHAPLTDPPRTTPSPSSCIHFKCHIQVFHFSSFILYFFLCLDMFRYTSIYPCVVTAYSIQYGNIIYKFVA